MSLAQTRGQGTIRATLDLVAEQNGGFVGAWVGETPAFTDTDVRGSAGVGVSDTSTIGHEVISMTPAVSDVGIIGVAPSTYYAAINRPLSARRQRDAQLKIEIG